MSQVPIKTAFDFFYHLESQNFSGEVQVTSSQGHALLLIQEGQLIWAHRPIERAVEKWSKLNWLHLPSSSAIATCRDWADFVSQVFHLNPDNFRRWMDLLKMDRLEVFYRIFFWKNLEFISRPFAVETPPSTLAFYSPRKLSILLTEAKRRVEEWPRIREKIGSSQRLFISNLVLN